MPSTTELELQKEFQELDEAFINYTENIAPILINSSDMQVQHVFELPIHVQLPGSIITYEFSTVQGDISFGAIFYSTDKRPPEVIIEPHRVPSDVENITGRFKAGREGTLVIKFDNSFSWFTPKYLSYAIEMHQPSISAADNHRCAKSRHLLKGLVEETPLLESDLVASMKASSSLRSELLELEAQLKLLQMQVDTKGQELNQKLSQVIYIENRLESNKDRSLGLYFRCLNRELLSHVLQYLYTDRDSSMKIAFVCKYWQSLSKKQPLYTRFFSKYQVVFVLGGPGSGKGTNCTKIMEHFSYIHLSAGDLLREARQSGGELGNMINTYIKEGLIVPAEVTVNLLKNAMQQSGKMKFLVDGFPRDVENLKCWEDNMMFVAEVQFLLFLDCPQDIMLDRLLERGRTSGRSDDNKESIIKRFKTYEDATRPIINHFAALGKIRTVDSNRDPDKVFADISLHFR